MENIYIYLHLFNICEKKVINALNSLFLTSHQLCSVFLPDNRKDQTK